MFPFKFLKSQSNLDSIVYQKKRIQFEIKELDRNFYVKSNKDNLIYIKDIETGKNLNWEMKIYDRNLNLLKDTLFELDRSYAILKIYSDNRKYEIIFKKNYSNEKEYLHLLYDLESNNIKIEKINLPLSVKINNVLFYNESIIFFGSLLFDSILKNSSSDPLSDVISKPFIFPVRMTSSFKFKIDLFINSKVRLAAA